MNIEKVKIISFSPTGTSKKVAEAIARGVHQHLPETIDITKPEQRTHVQSFSENDLLIVAVPVYMGRVPDLATVWLKTIEAHATPAIAVVVYGNRTYGDALLELSDILTDAGCIVVAGAAFIGEHSFSSTEYPCSPNRPDLHDIKYAELFGQKVFDSITKLDSLQLKTRLNLPGTFPYVGLTKLWDVDFIHIGPDCIQCGLCAENCPAGAIDATDNHLIDIEKCITCCACIKNCPQNARSMKPGLVMDAAIRINKLYNTVREPEFFYQ